MLGTLHICDERGDEVTERSRTGWCISSNRPCRSSTFATRKKPKARSIRPHPNWSALGDVGYVDDEGYLFLTDRATFMIISGGVNIYPQEIEDAMIMHPKVADVAVVGVPEPEMGEEVKAVVQPAAGHRRERRARRRIARVTRVNTSRTTNARAASTSCRATAVADWQVIQAHHQRPLLG